MFEWLNKQGVRSDSGFAVQCIDRFTFEYREGSRAIRIPAEIGLLGEQPCVTISNDAFANWSSVRAFHSTAPAEQARLMKNFREALEFQGIALTTA